MADLTSRARCTCGHCARCAKILRAAIRRETAAPARRNGIGPVARPRLLDLLASRVDPDAAGWTSTWAEAQWSMTVYEDRGAWCARLVLDDRFAHEVGQLGDTGMNVDRTAMAELGGSRFGIWARHGETATTQAHRPDCDRNGQR